MRCCPIYFHSQFYDITFQLVPLWKYKLEPLTANEPVVPVGRADCGAKVIIVDIFNDPLIVVFPTTVNVGIEKVLMARTYISPFFPRVS